MISEERKYRAFSSQRNVPLELLFGRKYNGTSKLDVAVLHMWLKKTWRSPADPLLILN